MFDLIPERVIPCLLVQKGRLVKTVKFKNPSYVGDPVNAIKIYNDKEVDELILLDINVTTEGRSPSFQLIESVASECFMPLCYGGGVRSIDEIRKIFALGVEKVSIKRSALEDTGLIKAASVEFGSQSIVVSIDVKKTFLGKYVVHADGGRKPKYSNPVLFAQEMEKVGAGEILLNSVDRDGTWEGYDIPLIQSVSAAVDIPVIACGGAGCLVDFRDAVREGGASAVATGSMVVYQKKNLGVLINFPSRDELNKVMCE